MREAIIQDAIRPDLHSYMCGVLRTLGSAGIEINSEPDHAHAWIVLGKASTLDQTVGELKRASSAWLKTTNVRYAGFHWQNGYAAFSVSQSSIDAVRKYIRNQRAHHRSTSYQDELRQLFQLH